MDSNDSFCPFCGTIVKTDDTFCGNCGASLDPSSLLSSAPVKHTPEENNPYVSQSPTQTAPKKQYVAGGSQLPLIALILGICSTVLGLIPFFLTNIAVGLGAIAVIIGIFALREDYKRHYSIIGIVLGLIGIALFILSILNLHFWDFIL